MSRVLRSGGTHRSRLDRGGRCWLPCARPVRVTALTLGYLWPRRPAMRRRSAATMSLTSPILSAAAQRKNAAAAQAMTSSRLMHLGQNGCDRPVRRAGRCAPAHDNGEQHQRGERELRQQRRAARATRACPRCERMSRYRMRKLLVATQAVENASPRWPQPRCAREQPVQRAGSARPRRSSPPSVSCADRWRRRRSRAPSVPRNRTARWHRNAARRRIRPSRRPRSARAGRARR